MNPNRLTGMSIPFGIVLTYYWLMQFVGTVPAIGIPEDTLYTMFVAPMSAFALVGVGLMLIGRRSFGQDVWVLATFFAVVVVVSMARTDIPTILTLGMLSMTLAVILHFRIQISPTHLNILFLLSIPLQMAFFWVGWAAFPVVPSFSSIASLSWRVSLFPLISSGGFFALAVFFVNVAYTSGRFRMFCLPASAYFLLFSGMRTCIFATVLAGAYMIARRNGFLHHKMARFAFFAAAVAFFTLSIFSSDQLARLPIMSNDFIRSLVVRQDNLYGIQLGGEVYSAAIRSWMIGVHLDYGMSSPLIGIGTFDFQMMQSGYGQFDDMTTGSEAYLTGLFARIGLLMLPLLYILYRNRQQIPPAHRDFVASLKLVLFLAMITYGSFMVPYDFIFCLLVTGILNGYAGEAWMRDKMRGRPEAVPRPA